MIKIPIDCNYNYLGPDKPIISEPKIKEFNLLLNQKVIACQEDEEWVGIIKFEESCPEHMQWYIQLQE
jgi:hypothetical protein